MAKKGRNKNNPGLIKKQKTEIMDWRQRQHEEISKIIRNSLLTLIVCSFFCLLILGQPDTELLEGKINVPLIGVEINFFTFLFVGPVVLLLIS